MLLSVFSFLSITACNHSGKTGKPQEEHKPVFTTDLFNTEDFATQLSAAMPAIDTADSMFRTRKILPIGQATVLAYQMHDYAPYWFDKNGLSSMAGDLLRELEEMRWDGLDPERYQLTALRQQADELKKATQAPLDKVIAFDTTCTRSYLQASRDLLLGMLSPRSADSLWFHTNDSAWLAPRTLATTIGQGSYASLKDYRSTIPAYALLQKAYRHYSELAANDKLKQIKQTLGEKPADSIVSYIIHTEMPDLVPPENDSLSEQKRLLMAYQYYTGQRVSGVKDSATVATLARDPDSVTRLIAANMERMRWLPASFEEQYIIVDVPMMEFFMKKGTENIFHMRVVVGKPSRQTPSLNARMVNVVFNPSWGVPPTILKKDVLPGLTKSGASYLRHKGLRAYDHNGNAIDAGSINESNYKRYTYKQPPGDDNSLGVIKFNMPNPWDIYMHDTPHKEDFPNRYRAKSSGCVRLQQPRELAEFIFTQLESNEKFSREHIDSMVATHKTKYEPLKNKIPVHIVYLTTFEDSTGTQLRFLSDVYKRDAKLMALMNK
jgi:murein L,D-transpeptidase YcbB/YkuD